MASGEASLSSGAAPTSSMEFPDQRVLSHYNQLPPDAVSKQAAALAARGIRPFPFPFGSALAIVSDIDHAERSDYEGYVSALVHDAGLDFGDSCFLLQDTDHRYIRSETWTDLATLPALAWFSYDGRLRSADQTRDQSRCLSSGEMLKEYHLGNIDHFHGLAFYGPRLVCFSRVVRNGPGTWSAQVGGELESRRAHGTWGFVADDTPTAAFLVQGLRAPQRTELWVRSPRLPTGAVRYLPTPPDAGWRPRVALESDGAAVFVPEGLTPPPPLAIISDVLIVEPQIDHSQRTPTVVAASTTRPVVLACLRDLANRFNVRVRLWTDHASKLWLNAWSEEWASSLYRARIDASRDGQPVPALCAVSRTSDLWYSTLGDDPASSVYCLDVLRDELKLAFVNPASISGEECTSFEGLANVVVPALCRDGSSIYVARRVAGLMPGVDDTSHSLRHEHGTRSFALRISFLLRHLRENPGRVVPLFTHLGNVLPKTERSKPYLPPETCRELQDHAFNRTGLIPVGCRAWVARPTHLYDYALILRTLPHQVSRENARVIRIRSWLDPVLGTRMPLSPSHLHGVTFYVDDSASARAFLDDTEIESLQRNAPDETAKPSVTIVGSGIRHVVLDEAHEGALAGLHGSARAAWITGSGDAFRGCDYLRVWLQDSGQHFLRIETPGLWPMGTQYLGYATRRCHRATRVAVVVCTESGASFLFGDPIVTNRIAPLARYAVAARSPSAWDFRVCPFGCLEWSAGSGMPGDAMPNHPISHVLLVVEGPAGEAVDFDRLEFLRPISGYVGGDPPTIVVGGRVIGGVSGVRVRITCGNRDRPFEVEQELTDPAGYFAFTGVPRGSVAFLAARDDSRTWRPVRGPALDVWSDDMSSVLVPA